MNAEGAHDERLAALEADFARLLAGWQPAPDMLDKCPLLDDWRWTNFPLTNEPALAGIVRGHPLLGDDRTIVTSPVMAVGVTGHWARTMSRFYRLGRPHSDV